MERQATADHRQSRALAALLKGRPETPPAANGVAAMGLPAPETASLVKVDIRGVSKEFFTLKGRVSALRQIDIVVREHEFVCIVGPSGSGKTTLFNIIAGLIPPTSGHIVIDGHDVTGSVLGQISYMFQKDLLVPWRTVIDNVTLGLEVHGVAKAAAVAKAREYVRNYGLAGFENAYPGSLSGGMRQRVALMRTMILDNDVILMDEPFKAIDYPTKLAIETEVRQIAAELGKTVLFVTHDIEEAVSLGDRVFVLTRAPGTVKAVHDVGLFRQHGSVPGARADERFHSYFALIWQELDEIADMGRPAAEAVGAAV
jgi:NitT/TauT family transport system ATP-binding protein